MCFSRSKTRAFLFWAVIFAFIFFDDAFSYHEQFGKWLFERFDLPALPGLRPRDTGELLAWFIAAVFLLVPLIWSLRRRGTDEVSVHVVFGAIFLMLAFFAMFVDMAHEAVTGPLNKVVNWIEDGGEMLSLVAAFACALLFFRTPQEAAKAA